MKFSELLKQKRNAADLTLQEVADAAGISKGHLHDLESGKHSNPGLLTCTRIALTLGISVQCMAAACIEQNLKDIP